jgi:hypothetical protein
VDEEASLPRVAQPIGWRRWWRRAVHGFATRAFHDWDNADAAAFRTIGPLGGLAIRSTASAIRTTANYLVGR